MPIDKDEGGKYRLVHAKHNLSVRANDLLFTPTHVGKNPLLHTVTVEWASSSEQVEVDTALDKAKETKAKPKKLSAAEWLFDYLHGHGPTLRQEVLKAGAMAGYKEKALINAASISDLIDSTSTGGLSPQAIWSVGHKK